MLLGAAIFPETSKYGGGPEKMAIVAVRQRWRRCLGEIETAGFSVRAGRKTTANVVLNCSWCCDGGPCEACESLICVEF